MTKYSVGGSSLALVKDGRLVYAEGFGVMDRESEDPVEATSLFRIAGISKPVTSAALMLMLEKDPALLNSKVFGSGGILGTRYGTQPYSQYERDITVQHLLEHTAGGEAWGAGQDPLFAQQQLWSNFTELIGWTLDTRDPSSPPGTHFSYSHFGYIVLGRVIEQLSSQAYQTYVQEKLLRPIGAHGMKIGRNEKSEAYPNEVTYYSSSPWSPYYPGLNLERLDASGGWVASAVDLARFLVHFDGSDSSPDLISKSTYDLMVSPSSANQYYAKGWSVDGVSNIWHTGALPGTGAFAMSAANGISAIFLINYNFQNDMGPITWEIIQGIKSWPKNLDKFSWF